MIIAYVRVSTSKQHPANQEEEIRRFAESRNMVIDRYVSEVVSGKTGERNRKLGLVLRRMKRGDTLIVTEVSRLSRRLAEIMSIMSRCVDKGINLYTTKEGYAFDNTINSKVLCFAFGLVAEIERSLISMRTKEALMLRKSEGVVLGRKKGSCTKMPILIKNKRNIIELINSGVKIGDICRRYGVSRDTFGKFRKVEPDVQRVLSLRKLR